MNQSELETEFDTPEASPGFALWQATNQWQSQQRRALQAFDLTHVQFVLMASLAWNSKPSGVSQKELATHAQTDVMMTSQVVRTLEKKGLLTRRTSPRDKRAILLQPTKSGLTLVNKAVRVVEQVDKDFFAVLGPNIRAFTTMLQKLAI